MARQANNILLEEEDDPKIYQGVPPRYYMLDYVPGLNYLPRDPLLRYVAFVAALKGGEYAYNHKSYLTELTRRAFDKLPTIPVGNPFVAAAESSLLEKATPYLGYAALAGAGTLAGAAAYRAYKRRNATAVPEKGKSSRVSSSTIRPIARAASITEKSVHTTETANASPSVRTSKTKSKSIIKLITNAPRQSRKRTSTAPSVAYKSKSRRALSNTTRALNSR
jgi:hypothetical protein